MTFRRMAPNTYLEINQHFVNFFLVYESIWFQSSPMLKELRKIRLAIFEHDRTKGMRTIDHLFVRLDCFEERSGKSICSVPYVRLLFCDFFQIVVIDSSACC